MPDSEGSPTAGGGLNKKVAGMPLWMWGAVAATLIVGVGLVWRAKNKPKTPTTPTTPTADNGATGLSTDQYEALLAQMRDLQSNEAGEEDKEKHEKDKPPEDNTPFWTSDGKTSLNAFAKRKHTGAAQIIWLTTGHASQPAFNGYVNRAKFGHAMPANLKIYYPKGR